MSYPKLIENLIVNFSKLPGVGRRSAERMAFWFLDQPREEAQALAQSVIDLKENLMFCRVCHHLSDTEICPICSDTNRDDSLICVVEDPKDVIAIEKTGAYRGRYHVLLGTISPGEGRGPEDLKIQQLIQRVSTPEVKEVIIATDADNDGEMTALYLGKQLSRFQVKVSRIGLGLPMGSAVEYADISTLSMSLTARREVKITGNSL
ncbi:MAG: recombination protein RecR [Candidatus Omnitrophica bacterium]|nr:recombination protein RecR [Candidatus Omnitrophota bacterium]MCA9405537.1 recombination protein RecR [Candidatus Omnitrophota bacterium]